MNALPIELCELIRQAGDDPIRFEDPETHQVYIVIKQEIFERLREDEETEHSDPSFFEFEDYQSLP